MTSFGSLLRTHRARAGLTQQALAERSGLSLRGLSDLERGARRAPYPDTIRRLADALGLGESERLVLITSSGRLNTRGDLRAPSRAMARGVPVPLSSFVGRKRELREIQPWLTTARLLTLTGVAGVGKTRLALELAAHSGRTGMHVAMVELAPVRDPGRVMAAVAAVLGIREQPHQLLVETVAAVLRNRELLLILDNCEHLVMACAELADRLLRACPELRIMATSREPLGVEGEVVRRVAPLSLPRSDGDSMAAELVSSEAGQLFVERASAANTPVALEERNAAAVAEICRRLDGIPLAVELAASRVGVLTVQQIASRLDDRFALLSSGLRTAAARQHTLLAAVEWSYDLLVERERVVFERLSAFVGGADLQAAEEVSSGRGIEPRAVLDLLAQLVSKSLVLAETGSDGTVRYRLLETLGEFAADRLRQRNEWDHAHLRHATYFLQLAERAAPHALDADPVLERLERDHDNLRAALRFLIDSQDHERAQRLGAALGRFWFYRGYATEGRHWLAELLAMAGGSAATEPRAELCYRAGLLAWMQGDSLGAQPALDEGLQLARQLANTTLEAQMLFALGHGARARAAYEDAQRLYEGAIAIARASALRRQEVIALQGLAGVAADQGDYATARRHLEQVVSMATELGATTLWLQSLSILADVCRQQGDFPVARSLVEQALAAARRLGARPWIASCSAILAQVRFEQGEYEPTRLLAQESLALASEIGDQAGIARGLELVAQLAAVRKDAERALRLGAAVGSFREAIALPLAHADRERLETRLITARRTLPSGVATRAWADGESMSPEHALAIAIDTVRSRPGETGRTSAGDRPADAALTRREREVTVLVAGGLTNRQIGERLVISVGTVERHVSNILSKLELGSRSQLAVWAVQHGLQMERTAQFSH